MLASPLLLLLIFEPLLALVITFIMMIWVIIVRGWWSITSYAWRTRDRPEIRGIMTIGIGPVRYVAGWGFTDGMDAAFGWDGD
jgi:hypothetical protein